ncbi:MAG: triphosphoribosyl-dephospho-CoA synthase [Clostridiales bacterium]|nr:triphosphoribosyl-dephospho-CoA synthase [Clostridiales bacterium]
MEPVCWKITAAILQGILLEAATPGKPGLVCYNSNGSHDDMNILTFMAGSAALTPYFYRFTEFGYWYRGDISSLLKQLRPLGLEAEQSLLSATGGVNTQRGALFMLGLLGALAGYLHKTEGMISATSLFSLAKITAAGLVQNELVLCAKQTKTAGEKLFASYGATGIRGEAQSGFFNVAQYGLPALMSAFKQKATLSQAIVFTLLNLMAHVEDTTILWRGGLSSLQTLQKMAQEACASGSVFSTAGLADLETLRNFCQEHRLSPGGSADLVSVTLTIYLWQEGCFPVAIT